jgi:hypothetical protein
MAHNLQPFPWRSRTLLTLAAVALAGVRASAQVPTASTGELWRQPLLGRELISAIWKDEPAPAALPPGRSARFRMFGMVPGFVNDPLGLTDDDDPTVKDDPYARLVLGQGDNSPSGLQVLMGNDNPYFDMRQPGDPGGVGFTRVYSQMRLLETGTTSVCLNLQAVTPAGQQYGGLNDGPTILTPSVSLFQELGSGMAVQGFVGQNLRPVLRNSEGTGRMMQCGMGLQCPLVEIGGPDRGLYLFMQAVGRIYEGDHDGRDYNWAFVPGVHWRVSDKCWFSLGGVSRFSLLTCSWQF